MFYTNLRVFLIENITLRMDAALQTKTFLLTVLQQEDSFWSTSPLIHTIRMVLGILAFLAVVSSIFFVGGFYLTKTQLLRSMMLSTTQPTRQGYTTRIYSDRLIGLEGITQTPLRPAGKVKIRDLCYDAKTLGTYIAPGVAVVVISVEGTSITVQAL
mmetsp:Transcript_27587/g.63946  ORF Transcript_27587/g.63946 Transcript_27587/m.63946 type:complete len:157 (-) Transcript_27587:204-674(-)